MLAPAQLLRNVDKIMTKRMSLANMIAKLPDWIRHDLASKDKILRARAEETLLAMIEAAVTDTADPDAVEK
jgi:hypothetical protein